MNRAKFFLVTLILFFSFNQLHADYTVVQDRGSEKIKSYSLKDVEYKKIRLENGLQAYLISDPDTPKSGAALCVSVGQMAEPFEKVGLAHFVEHMISMGSEEYPLEAEFNEYISHNGGRTNAYTATDRTVYYFDINNDAMEGAINRFSASFIAPSFNANSMAREMQAINQEFSHRTHVDGIRAYLVQLELMNKEHPAQKWRCGNSETLASITRDDLVTWYQANYSSDKMNLVVYSQMPMNELVTLVDERFSKIPKVETKTQTVASNLANPKSFGKKVYIEPLKDVRSLSILWHMPSEFAQDKENHTGSFISDALSVESPRSLIRYLKEKNWVTSSGAYLQSTNDEICTFQVQFELTDLGLRHQDQIISTCFEAIHYLKDRGLPRYSYDEKVAMSKIKYSYQSRPDVFQFAPDMSSAMMYENLSTFPQKSSWPSSYNSQKMKSFLSQLKADNATYFVMAPNTFLNKNFDQVEQFYKTKYCVEDISEAKLKRWNDAMISFDFALPSPNPFIAQELSVLNVEKDGQSAPKLLHRDNKSTYYHMQDNQYFSPEVYYAIYINSPMLKFSAKNKVLADIYLSCLGDQLIHLAEQGSAAGLQYSLAQDSNFGLKLTVAGYDAKSELFLTQLLKQVKDYKVSAVEFDRHKQVLQRAYLNQAQESPMSQAVEIASNAIRKDFAPADEKAQVIEQITLADVEDFNNKLFETVYTQALLYGNIDTKKAREVKDHIASVFKDSNSYKLSEQQRLSVLNLSPSSSPQYLGASVDVIGNCALLYIGLGERDLEKNAALSIYSKMVKTPFFETLRTKQQTGYVVHSTATDVENQKFMCYYVVSNTHSARDLLARFELFNEDVLKGLTENPESQMIFEKLKTTTLTQLKNEPQSLFGKGQQYDSLLMNYNADFDYRQKCITACENLTYEQFLQFAFTYFSRQNPRRLAILVEGQDNPNQLDYRQATSMSDFKNTHEYTSQPSSPTLKEVGSD